MHSVRFLFLPMVLSLLLSGCAQTRETSSTIFAMNTVMELTAYGDSGQQVLDQATERIYQLEHLLSVTDENSDISAINHGEGAWVPVSQETFQLLSLALSYGRETQGALDITAYSAVHAWGFTTGEYRVPGPEELAELAGRDYATLSEGQKQLVILARALSQDTPVMLMDEPDSALDFVNRHMVLGKIRSVLHERRQAGLITLHDPNFALAYCDRLLLMQDGGILTEIDMRSTDHAAIEAGLGAIYGDIAVLEYKNRYIMTKR